MTICENTPTLQTGRLLLRRFAPDDAAALWELLRDEQVNRFLPWFPVQTQAEADSFLQQRFLESYTRPSGYRYAICLAGENRPVGYVWLSDDESHDFGYALRQDCWGRGLVTEAAAAVLQRIAAAGYPYITATHDVQNPASGRVMQKLGMTYCYSYREQWQPKDIPVVFRMYQRSFSEQATPYLRYWEQYEHFVESGLSG